MVHHCIDDWGLPISPLRENVGFSLLGQSTDQHLLFKHHHLFELCKLMLRNLLRNCMELAYGCFMKHVLSLGCHDDFLGNHGYHERLWPEGETSS